MPTVTIFVFQRSILSPFLTFSFGNTLRYTRNKIHQEKKKLFLKNEHKNYILGPKHVLQAILRDPMIRNVLFSENLHNQAMLFYNSLFLTCNHTRTLWGDTIYINKGKYIW